MSSPAKDSSPKGSSLSAIHVVLFFASAITIFASGLFQTGLDPFSPTQWTRPELVASLSYALWLLAIVASHEAGHFVAARRRGVEVSHPYFLPGVGPIPGMGVIPFFGTFGAFIRMKLEKIKAPDLMAIAGWGPVAGFVVTMGAVFIGVALSEPMSITDDDQLLMLGDSLLMVAATAIFHPEMGEGMELMLHPIGFAGWVGCLLTALNLLPIGQLDGGHLVYAVVGDKARWVARPIFLVLLVLGVFFFAGWLVLALLVWWMGIKHPPMLSQGPASSGERTMAWSCLVIFALTFTPTPVVVDALPQWLGWW